MIKHIIAHADALIEFGTDHYGPVKTPMFMATIDPVTRSYPEDETRPAGFKHRAYRYIYAPKGCAVYWDQPTLKALYLLSKVTSQPDYARAADDYMAYFMQHCTSSSGVFIWGNHYFYDAYQDCNVGFGEQIKPVDPARHAGLHEMRPYTPAWDEMYRVNPQAVTKAISAAAEWHLFDVQNGGFNRHADKNRSCAFLEAGAVLIESLAFLYSKTGDIGLIELADKMARYSYQHRNEDTCLIINNPTVTRWDGSVTTTEVGLWAHYLEKACRWIEREPVRPEIKTICRSWREMAAKAAGAYFKYGYDERINRFFGRLKPDGTPDLSKRSTLYQPGTYSNPWEYLFPTHDYPLLLGMAALDHLAKDTVFEEGAARLAQIVKEEACHHPDDQVRYAENYGRMIAYLALYAEMTGESHYRQTALCLAEEAIAQLERPPFLVGHTGAKWYDAIDGVGYLMLAILYLETGEIAALQMF